MMAANRSDNELLDEIRQRTIRLETRLMGLGTKLGFDLKDCEDIRVVPESRSVYLATLDVAYTSVIRECRRAGLHKMKVQVYYDGAMIAEMPV
jgi:hypothetical protein